MWGECWCGHVHERKLIWNGVSRRSYDLRFEISNLEYSFIHVHIDSNHPNNMPTSTFSPHFTHCQFALELCRDSNQLISTSYMPTSQSAHTLSIDRSLIFVWITWRENVDLLIIWRAFIDILVGIMWAWGLYWLSVGSMWGRSLIFCPCIPHILYILLLVTSTKSLNFEKGLFQGKCIHFLNFNH